MNEEELYYQVIEELSNNRVVTPLWEAALQNNDNDSIAAEEEYIRMRIVQLQQKQIHLAVTQDESNPIVFPPTYINNASGENGLNNDNMQNYPSYQESSKRPGNILGLTFIFLMIITGVAITYLLYLYLT